MITRPNWDLLRVEFGGQIIANNERLAALAIEAEFRFLQREVAGAVSSYIAALELAPQGGAAELIKEGVV